MAGEVSNNGMTSAAYAMRYWERRQEVVANNLANVNTEGFKGERVFARLLGNEPLPVIQSATDGREGTLRPTGAALDLALDGAGYFVVNTPTGEQLSRGGSFHIDDQRHIVDADGNALLSQNGPITLPREGGKVDIQKDGVLLVDGQELSKLRVETVPNTVRLQHAGGSRYLPDASRTPLAPSQRGVRQGFVEDSNVGSVESMVDMISVQRAYASIQKAMTTLDGVRGTIAMDLGKPV